MRRIPALLLLFALGACSGAPRSDRAGERDSARAADAALDNEVVETIALQDKTELQVLTNRVEDLEREVGVLKANPQVIDLELLTQRVQRLEARSIEDSNSEKAPTASAPDTSDAAERVRKRIDEQRENRQQK